MRKLSLISEAQFWELFQEIKVHHDTLHQTLPPLQKGDLLTEQQVCDLLGVSMRTMLRYRQRGYFHYIKFDGMVLYHRLLLNYDLLALSKIHVRDAGVG